MGVRLTWDEAVAKGYISAREAKKARSKTRSPGDGGNDRNPLQDKFVAAIVERFGGRYNVVPELIPLEGRNFRIDCALPELWLALEMDGWQYHGKYKGNFQADRERQNLLVIEGWRILRFFAKEIITDMDGVLDCVEGAVASIERKSGTTRVG